jgi:ABC-type glycerol-3-phosphate transport system permease component
VPGETGVGPRGIASAVGLRVAYLGLALWAVATLVPIWAVLSSSVKTTSDITSSPLGVPRTIQSENFSAAWTGRSGGAGFGAVTTLPEYQFALHSLTAVSIGVALAMLGGTLAGYALARNAERLRLLNRYFIVLLTIPAIVTWVPLFSLMVSLGLVNKPAGLGIVYGATVTPLVTVLMRTYFSTFPLDLIEAARVDGAKERWAFLRIVLPMSRAVLIVVALIQAIFLWNELALAEILLTNPSNATLPMGLIAFKSAFTANLGPEFASLVLAIIPTVLLYVFAQKKITQGMRLGALR